MWFPNVSFSFSVFKSMFYSFVRQSKTGKPKLKNGAGNTTPSHGCKSPGDWEPTLFQMEVFLSFHIMQPFKEMEFHSQNHPLHELTDSTETKREAVFLSVFRKEIIVN